MANATFVWPLRTKAINCLLYTSDAADEEENLVRIEEETAEL